MDWRYTAPELSYLARAVAVLLSLATAAALAAVCPPNKRRELLDIIRLGEEAGLWFAGVYGGWDKGVELPDIGDGYGPDNARRLAVSLRAIAMALYYQLRLGESISKTFVARPPRQKDVSIEPEQVRVRHAILKAARGPPNPAFCGSHLLNTATIGPTGYWPPTT